MIRTPFLTLLLGACLLSSIALAEQPEVHRYKGNTHTHTLNSDGDSTPDDVVKWYRLHGYDFVFITDHGMITDVDPLNALFGGGGQFLVIRGEEVTSNYKSPELHEHVNALNPSRKIDAQKGTDQRDTLQKDLDVIRTAGGLPQINHPNFMWQLTADDIAARQRRPSARNHEHASHPNRSGPERLATGNSYSPCPSKRSRACCS